ncbi:hypothetical protein QN413_07845 [Variovorax sp. LG9.2]|nr:hypothetical protein [Variovorax sp. LG9.2]
MGKSAQSIVKRQEYMKCHYSEVERLVGTELQTADSEAVLFKLMWSDTAESRDFHHRRTHVEANLVALLQCVHAIEDTLAHVIYFAKNFDQLDADKVNIYAVKKLLSSGDLKDEVQ